MILEVHRSILESNDSYAERNRMLFRENQVYVLNLISSPGAGKTTVLEALIPYLNEAWDVAVIEGDLYTAKDAERIMQLGIEVIQINTQGACHLDACMIWEAAAHLNLKDVDVLIIENVGNLVCPAEFNLGENMKVHIASVTEGNDKPLKYPLVYEKSEAVLLNKIDLLSYTDFRVEEFQQDIKQLNPGIQSFLISARLGTGIKEVAEWLIQKTKKNYSESGFVCVESYRE